MSANETCRTTLFILDEKDANTFARDRIGRDFTAAEMPVVKRCVHDGMGANWAEIVEYAVEDAIAELGLTAEGSRPC